MEGRYIRQEQLAELGRTGQEKLSSSRVLLVGAGGLSSSASLYLAGAGVGHIGICDGDKVELINLHRQIVHTEENIGKNKAISEREALLRRNSEIEVVTIEEMLTAQNADRIVSGYDFVLDCTDDFESKFLINDACVRLKKPFTHAGVVCFSGQVMTYVPQTGPCLRCLLEEAPKKGSYPLCKDVGVMGPMVGLIGCVEAMEAIKYLTGCGELLTGRILRVEGLTMQFSLSPKFPKRADCPVCGTENKE